MVHGMRHYASAADETPFKAVLLSVWAMSSTPSAKAKSPGATKASQLQAIVQKAIGAANIMVPACCVRPPLCASALHTAPTLCLRWLQTSHGFVRCWLRLVLNAGLLLDAFKVRARPCFPAMLRALTHAFPASQEILSNAPVITAFYEDGAVFSQVDLCDAMFQILHPLADVTFNLKWNDSSLDVVLHSQIAHTSSTGAAAVAPTAPQGGALSSTVSAVLSAVGSAIDAYRTGASAATVSARRACPAAVAVRSCVAVAAAARRTRVPG